MKWLVELELVDSYMRISPCSSQIYFHDRGCCLYSGIFHPCMACGSWCLSQYNMHYRLHGPWLTTIAHYISSSIICQTLHTECMSACVYIPYKDKLNVCHRETRQCANVRHANIFHIYHMMQMSCFTDVIKVVLEGCWVRFNLIICNYISNIRVYLLYVLHLPFLFVEMMCYSVFSSTYWSLSCVYNKHK